MNWVKKVFSYYNEPITIKHNWALVLYGVIIILSSEAYDAAWQFGLLGFFLSGLFLAIIEERSE